VICALAVPAISIAATADNLIFFMSCFLGGGGYLKEFLAFVYASHATYCNNNHDVQRVKDFSSSCLAICNCPDLVNY
jgi:hypothetical protein